MAVAVIIERRPQTKMLGDLRYVPNLLLSLNRTVRNLVAGKLALEWSPEQISGWLRDEFPDDESMRVSHETIYRSLFIQARGVLKKELIKHLRTRRSMRRPHRVVTHKEKRGQIPDAVIDP